MSNVGRETLARAEVLAAEAGDYTQAIETLGRILCVSFDSVDAVLDAGESEPAISPGVERVLARCRADLAATS